MVAMIRRLLLVAALLVVCLPGVARADGTELRLDLSPGGTRDLRNGIWQPSSGAAVWCTDSSCKGAVTMIVPSGDGPVSVRSNTAHPILFAIDGLHATSSAGECTIDITGRTETVLEGRLHCRGLQDGARSVSMRGIFRVTADGASFAAVGSLSTNGSGSTASANWSLPDDPPTVMDGFEIIDDYQVTLDIQRDGSVKVTEQIDFDFGNFQRHGIEREIPISYRYEPDPTFDRILEIDDLQVTASDASDAVDTSRGSGRLGIRVGDADQTITGLHRYTITYTARGAMNGDKNDPAWDGAIGDHDELYWNAIGDEWTSSIRHASVSVHAPADILAAACYAGATGSTATCAKAKVDGETATFEQPGLYAGQGLSVDIALPVGAVSNTAPILLERFSLARAFPLTPWRVGLALLLSCAVVFGLVRKMWKHGRDRVALGGAVDAAFATDDEEGEVMPLFGGADSPVEFAPPDGIRPGQMGTLVDGVANTLDVTATIVDLASRGFIRIEEVPKDGFFGKDDYRFVWLGNGDAVLPYEQQLLDGLFGGEPQVLLSDLRLQFAAKLDKVKDALYTDMANEKWFTARPDKIRTRWNVIGFLSTFATAALFFGAFVFTSYALFIAPLFVGALIMWIGAKWMPQRTAKGTGVLRRSLGFRTFITDSEAIRAKFAENNNIFTEYLPYAIVFGCTKRFAKAFQGLEDQMAQPSWYVGTHPFVPWAFADTMSHFSVATGGTLASTPGSSGSSGFGGGGFSGGGFGGGGGGSW